MMGFMLACGDPRASPPMRSSLTYILKMFNDCPNSLAAVGVLAVLRGPMDGKRPCWPHGGLSLRAFFNEKTMKNQHSWPPTCACVCLACAWRVPCASVAFGLQRSLLEPVWHVHGVCLAPARPPTEPPGASISYQLDQTLPDLKN